MRAIRICAFRLCDRVLKPKEGRLCPGHYMQRKRGKTMMPLGRRPTRLNPEIFNELVLKETGGCWIWHGRRMRQGYGRYGKSGVMAHRYSWELHVGPIPDGLCVCHKCDNPPCVNPLHLFVGTIADNNRDKVEKGRGSKGSTHGRSKIAEPDVILIRNMFAVGASAKELSSQFGLQTPQIYSIVRGDAWSHV